MTGDHVVNLFCVAFCLLSLLVNFWLLTRFERAADRFIAALDRRPVVRIRREEDCS